MNDSDPKQLQQRLTELPSVDELLRSDAGLDWLDRYPRSLVLSAVRNGIDGTRRALVEDPGRKVDPDTLHAEIDRELEDRSRPRLRPLINATGVILHTNLGRAPLAQTALDRIQKVAAGYSNLEFQLETGRRGKRYDHVREILREITGAEDALVVNNNAAAVLLCLTAMAAGREVIVSRGELIEIGGSFRIPDVMRAGGARLREVGATNKTHRHDYANAIGEETALLLKVHPSNYRITGFSKEVSVEELISLGRERGLPVLYDLGSGSLMDLSPYGIPGEPAVGDVLAAGTDVVTFSGDKLLGGPQGGVIAGRHKWIDRIQKHPLTRALRIDKMTLAGMEATFQLYRDFEQARTEVPVLAMLTEDPSTLRRRADRLARRLRRGAGSLATFRVVAETSQAGGGSLPETSLPTWAVAVHPSAGSVAGLEKRLRRGKPTVVARVKDDALLLDLRTVRDHEIAALAEALRNGLPA